MSMQSLEVVNRNILSDEFKADPYPTFRWWHANEKAFRDPEQNYWVSFDYAQVRKLLMDARLTVERYDNIPTMPEEVKQDKYIREMLGMWMLNMDGGSHSDARREMIPMFSTRALRDYEELIREQIAICIDGIGDEGRQIEAYSEVAFPLPARIVLSIMGLQNLSAKDLDKVRVYSDVISTYVGSAGRAPGCIKPTYDTIKEFCDFLIEKVDVNSPGFERTLTARIIAIYGDGKPLKDSIETLSNIILFVVSGFETTTNLILNSLLAIGRDPSLEDQLRADPSLIEQFIDETLRIYPPVNRTARKAVDDVDIDGQTIKKGELAILFLGAANRDPTVFPNPDKFKIKRAERRKNSVLSFGHGPHLCIGRMLSIMELRIFYEELLKRYACLDVDVNSVQFRDGSLLKGISKMYFAAKVPELL